MELGFLTNDSQNPRSSRSRLPSDLHHLLSEMQQRHYEELYEEDSNGKESLEDALTSVLNSLCSLDPAKCHSRYIWMAVLLGLAAKPTVEAYLQNDSRPNMVIVFLLIQLEQCHHTESILKRLKPKDDLLSQTISSSEMIETLFPKLSEGCQALDESIDILRNGLRVVDQNQSKTALLNILGNCFEGYAIFPGASGRHELLNWWIDEVIPATWSFQLPKHLYTIKGLQSSEEILASISLKDATTLLLDRFCRSKQGF